jgi:rhodanese-related sulfurtransferase
MLDVRDERQYNQFHIHGARRLSGDEVVSAARQLMFEPANTVFIVMSSDEAAATEAWKRLKAESLPNVYILAGGVNNWIRTFSDAAFTQAHALGTHADDQPAFRFDSAIGARHAAAEPNPYDFKLEFEPKVKMIGKRAPEGGGCG